MIPKFRAWGKPGVLSNHPDGVVADAKPDFLGMTCLVKRDDLKGKKCFTEIIDFEDIELMQSTGLKDKNGVEIFEGDIIEYPLEKPNIPFGIDRVLWNKHRASWVIGGENFNCDLFHYVKNNNTVKVIGNIYENPELLEVEG